MKHLILLQQRHILIAQVELYGGQHVLFAIEGEAFQVFVFPVDAADIAAVDVVFGRGEAQDGGQQLERSVVFAVAEFPHIHRVQDVVGFPGFFSGDVERDRKGQLMNDHPAADIGDVELFGVVAAEAVFVGVVVELEDHLGELVEQLLFVFAGEGFQAYLQPLVFLVPVNDADGDTDDLAEFGEDGGAALVQGGVIGFFLIGIPGQLAGLGLPEVLEVFFQVFEFRLAGNGFNVQEKNIGDIHIFRYCHVIFRSLPGVCLPVSKLRSC